MRWIRSAVATSPLMDLLGAVVIVYGGIYALRLEGGAWPRKAALVILSDEDKP